MRIIFKSPDSGRKLGGENITDEKSKVDVRKHISWFFAVNIPLRKKCNRSFSGPHFPTFGLNTERYSLCFRIQPEYEKIRTTKTLNKDTFHAVFTMQLYTVESEIATFQQRMIIIDS